ncbi:MAG: hypothetical protein FWG85_04630 [Bacteroidetes bacterium]|nr:hypothetical protein [Bacteroidota bacterium]
MEALELVKPRTKYINLNQYESIPALDRALAEPNEPESFNSFEEYLEWQNNFLKEDNNEI